MKFIKQLLVNYELANHTVKVKRTGALVDVVTLWDLEGIF